MLNQEEIVAAAHTAVMRARMPTDLQLTVAGGTYEPPDTEPEEIIRIQLLVMAEDEEDNLEVVRIIKNTLTQHTFEVYMLGFLVGAMAVLEASEEALAAELLGDAAGVLH